MADPRYATFLRGVIRLADKGLEWNVNPHAMLYAVLERIENGVRVPGQQLAFKYLPRELRDDVLEFLNSLQTE